MDRQIAENLLSFGYACWPRIRNPIKRLEVMAAKIRGWIIVIFGIYVSVFTCFSKAHLPDQQRPSTQRGAPFLQHAQFYEETQHVTKMRLKNGLTILVNEFHAQPVVAIQVHMRVGYFDEPVQNPGVSRILEGMVYQEAPTQAAEELRQNTQTLGGVLRSSTDYKNTLFEIVTRSSQWRRALEIQAETLRKLTLEQEAELKQEIGFVQNLARSALDNPFVYAYEKLLNLGFDQQPMGKWGKITDTALLDLNMEELFDFYQKMYVPSRMILVISGDITTSEVLDEVVQIYAEISGRETKSASPFFKTRQSDFRYSEIRGDVPIPQLHFGFHTASANAKDYPALEVLSALLGMGEGSVLVTRLRDQKKVISSVGTHLIAYPDFGYLTIRMEVDNKDIDRSEIALLTELELLKRQEPDKVDVMRAIAQLERKFWKKLETVTGRAHTLARFETLGDWKKMDNYILRIRQVKPADIKRVATNYLRLNNCSLVEYLPASAEQRNLTPKSMRETLEGLLDPSTKQEEAERRKQIVSAVTIPETKSSSFKFSEIRYPLRTASILRGPDIFIREDHTTPLVEMGFFYPGGKFFETQENSGITKLMLRSMLRGVSDKNPGQICRQLEVYGGWLQPIVADDYFGFLFSILAANVEPGLELLGNMIKSPEFDRDEVKRQKQFQLMEINHGKYLRDYSNALLKQALFEDFSYALDASGSEISLTGINADDLQSWYEMHVKNRKPIVTIIGDTQGTSLASYFVKNFSGSRFQNMIIPEKLVEPLEREVLIEKRWNNSQSIVILGFHASREEDMDTYPLTVLENYHPGSSGRIFESTTGPQEAADRFYLKYEPRLRGGSMVAWAATMPGNEENLFKMLRQEIQRLVTSQITYRNYRSAMNLSTGRYWINRQARFCQIAAVIRSVLAGKGFEGYEELPARLEEVNEDDLQDVAQRVLNIEKSVTLYLHGRSSQ